MTAILDRSSNPATSSTDPLRGQGSAVLGALAALRAGQPVILRYDDEAGRETGDLLLAAGHAAPAMMAFFLQNTSGYIYVALSPERSAELGLPATPMNDDVHCSRLAFTAMVDETTASQSGLSAFGRSRTARALADLATRPGHLSRSGHTPVVTSRSGGVLECPGRAEAAVDLVRLANLVPAGVLSGILSDDALGMANGVELDSLANRHGLVSVRIAELMRYRRRHEGVVRRRAEARIPTEFGAFRCVAYDSTSEDESYVALVWGDVPRPGPVFVGFHTESVVDDVFGGSVVGRRSRLYESMRSISQQMAGVLVYFRSDGVLGACSPSLSNGAISGDKDAAAQILVDLGVQEVSLLPGGETYVEAMSAYGFRVSGHASAEVP